MYKRLDRDYSSEEFVKEVDEFIKFAIKDKHYKQYEKLKCPCDKCLNVPYLDEDTVKLHLYKNGFRPNYYQLNYHGELDNNLGVKSSKSASNRREVNQMRDMVMNALGSTSSTWDKA